MVVLKPASSLGLKQKRIRAELTTHHRPFSEEEWKEVCQRFDEEGYHITSQEEPTRFPRGTFRGYSVCAIIMQIEAQDALEDDPTP